MGTDILLVGIAFEQAAGNGGNLRSGNVVVRLERSVCIACDPSASRRIGDGLCRPVRGRNIREGCSSVRQPLKPAADRCEFRAGDRCVWPECSIAVAADDPKLFHVADVVGRPVRRGHIGERCRIGFVCFHLLGQQAGKHGGHLCAAHIFARCKPAVRISLEEGKVVCFIQRRGFVGVLGVGVDKAKPALRVLRVDIHSAFHSFKFVVAIPAAGPFVFIDGIVPFVMRLEEPAGLIIRPTALLIVGFHNKDALIVG